MNDQVLPGYVPYDRLKDIVDDTPRESSLDRDKDWKKKRTKAD